MSENLEKAISAAANRKYEDFADAIHMKYDASRAISEMIWSAFTSYTSLSQDATCFSSTVVITNVGTGTHLFFKITSLPQAWTKSSYMSVSTRRELQRRWRALSVYRHHGSPRFPKSRCLVIVSSVSAVFMIVLQSQCARVLPSTALRQR